MKYVALGTLNTGAITSASRVTRAKKKLADLGIKIESIYYTQGEYDFVDVFDAPNPEAMLAFSVWYAKQGFGSLHSMPAFDSAAMTKAIKGGGTKRRTAKSSRSRK
jgi:uncharacterized protein with GYD domain